VDAPKTTYKGVEVVYNVDDNNWLFTLRGRDKSSSTLRLAIEAIDAPPPKNKKPFTPFQAYYLQSEYDSDYEIVTVTSLAENSASYRGLEVWVRHETSKSGWRKKGDRSKVDLDKLFAINPENDQKIVMLGDIEKEQEKLRKNRDAIAKSMVPTHIKKEDYD
jgi:hypothetical protein